MAGEVKVAAGHMEVHVPGSGHCCTLALRQLMCRIR